MTARTVLEPRSSALAMRCRCGTHLAAGQPCLAFVDPPVPVVELVDEVVFCGARCARAYLLEAIELFESSTASSVVRNLAELLAGLRRLYAQLLATAS